MVVPALLTGFIVGLDTRERNKIVKIQVYNQAIRDGLEAMLGTPINETRIYEYYLPIRVRK